MVEGEQSRSWPPSVVHVTNIDWNKYVLYVSDDERVYAYVRIETGDEMSKRQKFTLIVWVGPQVSAMKKGKMSTEKAFVKQVFFVSWVLSVWMFYGILTTT